MAPQVNVYHAGAAIDQIGDLVVLLTVGSMFKLLSAPSETSRSLAHRFQVDLRV